MVIDVAKGVEPRTEKLMDVCRLRTTPVMTFINKLDREGRDPIDLMDEVEQMLNIRCAPITWPVGMGKRFKGVYHLRNNTVHFYSPTHGGKVQQGEIVEGIDNPKLDEILGDMADELREELELIQGASNEFELDAYLAGELTPVFFGSAINNFGIAELLDDFVEFAPGPQARETLTRTVDPYEEKFSGFVFKIQANMDPQHRDRIAFMRICSGKYEKGMKARHVRIGKDVKFSDALTFFSSDRGSLDEAYSGDIIGLNNDLILGAVGILQFDVVAQRLKDEYKVDCQFETINVQQARWIKLSDDKMLKEFKTKAAANLSVDHAEELVYLAPTRVNLQMTLERWPEIEFLATREQSGIS